MQCTECSEKQNSEKQCSVLQVSTALQDSVEKCMTVQDSVEQCRTVYDSAIQCSARAVVQCSGAAVQCSTGLCPHFHSEVILHHPVAQDTEQTQTRDRKYTWIIQY